MELERKTQYKCGAPFANAVVYYLRAMWLIVLANRFRCLNLQYAWNWKKNEMCIEPEWVSLPCLWGDIITKKAKGAIILFQCLNQSPSSGSLLTCALASNHYLSIVTIQSSYFLLSCNFSWLLGLPVNLWSWENSIPEALTFYSLIL